MSATSTPPAGKPLCEGKIRSLLRYSDDLLVIVASDRISAYDTVMRQEIPDKGALLNRLSAFWFRKLADVTNNHFVALSGALFERVVKELGLTEHEARRAMVVRKARPILMECVVRGHITGAAWREYTANGTVNGAAMTRGMIVDQRLEAPIFTPSTKAHVGHDLPLTRKEGEQLVGAELYAELEKTSLNLYKIAYDYAFTKGLILADTKFEFGFAKDGSLSLIDELLTPDSSRWWSSDLWRAGTPTPPLDKQYLRNWLDDNWSKEGAPPDLPSAVVEATRARYVEAYERITETEFELE